MNLAEMLDSNARKSPTKACLRAQGRSYSYEEIKNLSKKAAGLFQSLGVQKRDRVALMSQNTAAFVVSFYGILKAGGVVVPVNHKLMKPEVEYILMNSESKLFLFDGSLADVALRISTPVQKISLDSPAGGFPFFESLLETAPRFQTVEIADEDLAELLYTSGTTGKPKGCMHTHRGVIMAGITAVIGVKLDEDDRLLMAMPIWHSSPLNNWFAGIQFVGGTTVLIREYHPLHFLQAIQQEKCTVYFGAPISYIMPLQMVPQFDQFDLSSMRAWIYGGGPIPAHTVAMIMKRYKSNQFYQVYGMTESGPTGTILPPKDQVRKAGSVGKTGLPGCDVIVMKSVTEPAKHGEAGEIWLKADSMMKGYYQNPEATTESFQGRWYKTGDMARVDEDGYLFMADRLKDMIVTGGENVYSKEVEDAIATHPDVMEAAVIAIPHPEWGETVGAIVVPAKGKVLTEEALKAHLADKIAKYKIPRTFRFVESLPHTPSGKVMKYRLRDEYRQ